MNLLEDLDNPLWKQKNIIYCYTNMINSKKYIGQTIKSLKRRHTNHISSAYDTENQGYNYYFHRAIRKYGIKNFSLEILHIADKYSLNLLEIYYIEKWNLLNNDYGYNISNGGTNGNPMAGKSEEEMKIINKKKSDSHKGKICSNETKNKISKANKGEKHGMYGTGKGVNQYDLNGNFIKTWINANQAGKELNIEPSPIRACCRGKQKTSGGFIWKYAEED